MSDRAEFEKCFSRPDGIFWDNEFDEYTARDTEYELDADDYNTMFRGWRAACAQIKQDVEPDWSDSKTLETEGWKNPLLSKNDRLQIADGAVAWRDEVIKNLRSRVSQPEGDGWIKCGERLPTEADGDFQGGVFFCARGWSQTEYWHVEEIKAVAEDKPQLVATAHWKPTGLKRPQPPQEDER